MRRIAALLDAARRPRNRFNAPVINFQSDRPSAGVPKFSYAIRATANPALFAANSTAQPACLPKVHKPAALEMCSCNRPRQAQLGLVQLDEFRTGRN